MRALSGFFWTFIILFSALLILSTFEYYDLSFETAFIKLKGQTEASQWWKFFMLIHIISGVVCLITGPFQFISKFRNRFLRTHKAFGYAYLTSVLFGAVSGIYVSFVALGELHSKIGFIWVFLLWLYYSYRAFDSIKNRDIIQHKQWMARSYALAYGIITFRIYILFALINFNLTFAEAFSTGTWMAWVINLTIAEYFIFKKYL